MAGRVFEREGTCYLRVTVPRRACISSVSRDRRAQRKIGPRTLALTWAGEVDGLIAAAVAQGQKVRAIDLIRQAGINLRGRLPGASPDPGTLTVAEYAPSWLETVTGSTRRRYTLAYERHIRPTFGALAMGQIRPLLIRRWLQGLERELAQSTTAFLFAVLRSMLSQAVRDEELARHPAPSLRSIRGPRRQTKVPKRVLSFEEIQRTIVALREVESNDDKRLLIELQAITGCRAGEALGLQWQDLVGHELHIRRQVHDGVVGPPKTRRARTVVLTTGMVDALRRHRARQHERALSRGRRAGPWICQTSVGRHYTYATSLRVWRAALEAAALLLPGQRLSDAGLGTHVLRHSSVTHKLAAGHSPPDVAAWHGMSGATMMREYAHAIPSRREAMALDFDSGQPVGNLDETEHAASSGQVE